MAEMKTFDLGKIVGGVPNIRAGKLTMVDGEENAKIRIEGTATNPVLHLDIPRPVFPDKVGDMSAKVYDRYGREEDVYGYTDRKVKASGHIVSFECTKEKYTEENGVYKLNNADLPGLLYISGVFKAPESYVKGDKFVINGNEYVAFNSDGTVLEEDCFVAGAVVPFTLDRENYTINFKSAGSSNTLPADVLLNCFTADGDFTAPQSGKYRITCIGKGGDGLESNVSLIDHEYHNGVQCCTFGTGGGAGGAGEVTVKLGKDDKLTIAIDDKTSIVSCVLNDENKTEEALIECTAGSKGVFTRAKNTEDKAVTVGNPGKCTINDKSTVIVPNLCKEFFGKSGSEGSKETLDTTYAGNGILYGKSLRGGDGGAYTEEDAKNNKFLSTVGGKGAVDYTFDEVNNYHFNSLSGMPPVEPSVSGFAPFGVGGGGGIAMSNGWGGGIPGVGGEGGSGAVIIELISAKGGKAETDTEEKPTITLNYTGDVQINKGESVTVYAKAESPRADAVFTYSWYKDGQQMFNYFDNDFVTQPYITLFDVTEDASGEYMVVVSDGVRACSEKFNIIVGDELVNVAEGKTYTLSQEPGTNYPDNGNDLTNGKITRYRYFKDSTEALDYVGFFKDELVEVVIDLGGEKEIKRIDTSMMSTDNAGVRFVKSVDFFVKGEDGEWQNVGEWEYPGPVEATPSLVGIMIADCKADVKGRYVKVKYNKIKDQWIFISEIQVFGTESGE